MESRSERIISEVKKVIVGKDEIIEKVLMTILAGGHILLEDVPGVGKTTLALGFSKALGISYRRVQFTPDTMASDVLGFSVYDKSTGKFTYKSGAVFTNLFLGDEINRTSAKTQAALLEAMEELQITIDGVTRKLPEPFVCIATQNPLGSAGTHPLPDSQLDRFMVRLSLGYPTVEDTINIVKERETSNPLETVESVVTAEEILRMKSEVSAVYAADEILRYTAVLCEKTRHLQDAEQGVSPRAALAALQMAKAKAFITGRDYVVPDDIKYVFCDVCAHRLILTPKAKIKKITAESLIEEVLKTTDAPKPVK